MNTYLTFNVDGTFFQQCLIDGPPNDGRDYIDVSTLDFEPDIFSNVYTLVDGQVQSGPIPEFVKPESQQWLELRAKRDHLLTSSDWTQVSDAPVDHAAWATYRQNLRDLPDNTTDPLNVTWPTSPN